jgi:hypothetical protein
MVAELFCACSQQAAICLRPFAVKGNGFLTNTIRNRQNRQSSLNVESQLALRRFDPGFNCSAVFFARRYAALVEMAAAAASKGRQVSLLVSIIEHALEIIYKHFQDSKAGSSEPQVKVGGSSYGCKRRFDRSTICEVWEEVR